MKNNSLFKNLLDTILSFEDPSELSDFLQGILTQKELEELPRRLEIIRLLKLNTPQQKIAKKLGVGIATVTRGSKEIQKGRFQNISELK